MKTFKRDNASISYHITGGGEITLLFVHGSYIDQTYWKSQVGFFNTDYTIVTLDLPGHGQSGTERKNWSVMGFAEDVVALMKELSLRNVVLIGHSLGAAVCLMAATMHPTAVLGFIAIEFFKNAGNPLPPEYQQQVSNIIKQLHTDFRNTNEQYARKYLLTPQTPAPITKKIVEAYRNAYQPMGIATTPEIFDLYQVEAELLPQLKCKLYVVNADYMPTNEAALQKLSPNGFEVLHIKGTSHYPMLENPDALNKLLLEAIQEISVDMLHTHNEY
jgi:pimeloyl-ACP methyl ester carboxylesterase